MAFNIQSFKSSFADGGARPTLYEVQITFPNVDGSAEIGGGNGTLASNKLMFTCSAASLPTSRLGMIEVPYFGRTIKVEGNRSYPDWMVTVINDESFVVRTSLEAWHAKINSIVPNIMDPDYAAGQYKVQGSVRQYSKAGSPGGIPSGGFIGSGGTILREYELWGMFPVEIGEVRLGWDQRDQLEYYNVSFAIDWWTIVQGVDASALLGTVGNISVPTIGS